MESGANRSLLLIDSDIEMLEKLRKRFAEHDPVRLEWVTNLQEGVLKRQAEQHDVVLIRQGIFGGDGLQVVSTFLVGETPPEIVIYTNTGDPGQIEEVLKLGIWEYVIDSAPAELLPRIVEEALYYRCNKHEETALSMRELRTQMTKCGIVGSSSILQNCINKLVRIAQSDSNVLISGESGTGKELFASAIHSLSSRANVEMTIVDCAALPPSLVESLLFGHIKGSFTGADRAQQGLVQQADGGTLFLDEIGELPLAAQKKLLRVIQERTYLPVGSTTERKSNFRLIAATNRDLSAMLEAGGFREDLFFRLKTFLLELPPLRHRRNDIAELIYFCRDRFCKRHKLKRKKFSPDYLTLLTQYEWPGNVRELFQAVERSLAEAKGSPLLYPKHLPPEIRIDAAKRKFRRQGAVHDDCPEASPQQNQTGELVTLRKARDQAVERAEKAYLKNLLSRTGGDINRSCELASVSRSRLYDLLKKYDLTPGKTV
jgi:two-component system, NtrC family, response regulator